MQKTIYYCDLCKKEKVKFKTITINIWDGFASITRTKGGSKTMNVCNDCMKDLGYIENKGSDLWHKGVVEIFKNLFKRNVNYEF